MCQLIHKMPRTKRVQAPKRTDHESKFKDAFLKTLDNEEKKLDALLDAQMQKELESCNVLFLDRMLQYPRQMLDRTILEIINGEVDSTMNSTTSMSKKGNKTANASRMVKRSASFCCDDEGYTTAESNRGTSGDRTVRMSRSRIKASSKPISRSLSRNTNKKVNTFRTPVNRQPPTSDIGSITPKVKPNTPQMILRRPKMGEMAWSNQGSPMLTTHTVASETIANVNIPLADGNLMSVLPHQGIRPSQLPSLDQDIRRQLEVLRDNLIQICGEYKRNE